MLDPLMIIEKSFAPCAEAIGITKEDNRSATTSTLLISIIIFNGPKGRIVVSWVEVLIELDHVDPTDHLGDE